MTEDITGRRRNLAQRIKEGVAGAPRKGLAQRIRESELRTQANLIEAETEQPDPPPVRPSESGSRDISPPTPLPPPVPTPSESADRTEITADTSEVEVVSISPWRKIFAWAKTKIAEIVSALKAGYTVDDKTATKGVFRRIYGYLAYSSLKKKILASFSADSHHIRFSDVEALRSSTRKKFRYAEVHRLRERITNELQEKNQSTLVITSPHDGTGNTFLVTVLALNAARFSDMEVLVVDTNMRFQQLHDAFGLDQNNGFTDVIKGAVPWEEVIKDTDDDQLKVMTAGEFDFELARHLNRHNIESLIIKMKEKFDFIIFDTSPVLEENRNNVDPALLSTICDKILVGIQGKKTTKAELDEAFTALTKGGGRVDGIVYNRQF